MRAGLLIALVLVASSPAIAAASTAQPVTPPPATPAALSLFERDWVLMNWALKYYDADGDALLSRAEASAAGEAFRRLADSDGDGRVTPAEFRAARETILERY